MLHKRVFVAHNVNFDYSFVVQELKLAGYNWKAPKLCTVRLARKIIPNMASYSLGKLCHNLNIPIHNRHRAMGDAEATVILFELLQQKDKENIILSSLRKSREQRLPTHIAEEDFMKLPETPGIYLFRDKSGKIIYIGKAINIRKRVLSHFTGNNSSERRQAFINEIQHIDFEESGTELMALLMECKMIKKHWPIHNRALKKYEPKFGLICYEDQNGYLRLAVSKFGQNMQALRYFERAVDGNQLMLRLMEDFHLDSRMCLFYAPSAETRARTSYHNLPTKGEYNLRVRRALADIKADHNSFVLFDQGRHLDERSYVLYKDSQLHAFGFVDIANQLTEIDDIITAEDRCSPNYYMNTLVLQYAARFPAKVCPIQTIQR
jgi:DNA polymerase-3 subunit epsilon